MHPLRSLSYSISEGLILGDPFIIEKVSILYTIISQGAPHFQFPQALPDTQFSNFPGSYIFASTMLQPGLYKSVEDSCHDINVTCCFTVCKYQHTAVMLVEQYSDNVFTIFLMMHYIHIQPCLRFPPT